MTQPLRFSRKGRDDNAYLKSSFVCKGIIFGLFSK